MMNPYRHFYLYAKNWYERADLLTDLAKLAENYTGVEAQYFSFKEIAQLLSQEVYKNICRTEYTFYDFLRNVSPEEWWKVGGNNGKDQYNYNEAVVRNFLSILSCQKVTDIEGELGEPDPNVLPLWRKENALA